MRASLSWTNMELVWSNRATITAPKKWFWWYKTGQPACDYWFRMTWSIIKIGLEHLAGNKQDLTAWHQCANPGPLSPLACCPGKACWGGCGESDCVWLCRYVPRAADPGLLAGGAALTRSSMFSAAACNKSDDEQILIGHNAWPTSNKYLPRLLSRMIVDQSSVEWHQRLTKQLIL